MSSARSLAVACTAGLLLSSVLGFVEGPRDHASIAALSDTLDRVDTTLVAALVVESDTASAVVALDEGRASYYGSELAGHPTASGERFDPGRLTAAHPTLPFGTRLRVTNLRNGQSVIVRVNDRGPFSGSRVLDLSYAAAKAIGMIRRGTARVRMEIVR